MTMPRRSVNGAGGSLAATTGVAARLAARIRALKAGFAVLHTASVRRRGSRHRMVAALLKHFAGGRALSKEGGAVRQVGIALALYVRHDIVGHRFDFVRLEEHAALREGHALEVRPAQAEALRGLRMIGRIRVLEEIRHPGS